MKKAKPKYKPVPVSIAKGISDMFAKSQVVILTYDPVHQLMHTTTYGVEALDKEQAAAAGELCTTALGCDLAHRRAYEDFHWNFDPARYREALEILQTIRARNGTTPPQLQQIERLLTAAGFGLRQG